MRLISILCCFIAALAFADHDPCMKGESCGQCIQQGPHCAWCKDPHTTLSARCQNRTRLEDSGKCRVEEIYTPVTNMRISPPVPIGGKGPNEREPVTLLEPQVVQMSIKKGEKITANFRYQHKIPAHNKQDTAFQIRHSSIPQDIEVKFFIQCHGNRIESLTCPDVPDKEIVEFDVQVEVRACKTSGDAPFSVGTSHYQAVAGVYVTPLCGCDCERLQSHEKNSTICSRSGSLVCGQCVCNVESKKGGSACECPLATYGVSLARDLDNKCRESAGGLICGGNGKCRCGKCQCDAAHITGEFCSCDNTSCPVGLDGRQCSANGVCECNKCRCQEGWGRDDCSCPTDSETCVENKGGAMAEGNDVTDDKEATEGGAGEGGEQVGIATGEDVESPTNPPQLEEEVKEKEEEAKEEEAVAEEKEAEEPEVFHTNMSDDSLVSSVQAVSAGMMVAQPDIPVSMINGGQEGAIDVTCEGDVCPIEIGEGKIQPEEESHTRSEGEESSSSSISSIATLLLAAILARMAN